MNDNGNAADIDQLADELMRKLLAKRDFQEILYKNVMKRVGQSSAEVEQSENQPQIPSEETTKVDPVLRTLDELTRTIDISIETFLKCVDLALCHLEGDPNRDASSIYAARMQVERLTSLSSLDAQRLSQTARRIAHLFSIFNKRISSPLQLANCSLFASSLCDLLYMIEEYISTNYSIPATGLGSDFHKSINRFNKIVIETLEKMVERARQTASSSKEMPKVIFRTPPARRPPPHLDYGRGRDVRWDAQRKVFTPGKSRKMPWDNDKKPSSWIMSKELSEAKSRLCRSAPRLTNPRQPQRNTASQGNRRLGANLNSANSMPSTARMMESKWKVLLKNENILARSMLPNDEGNKAFRMARQITTEVMEELKKRANIV